MQLYSSRATTRGSSPGPNAHVDQLARRLEIAERRYQTHPTRRNLDRQVVAFHAFYWARQEAAR